MTIGFAVVGDTHADAGSWKLVLERLGNQGVKTVVQLGDFSLWWRYATDWSRKFFWQAHKWLEADPERTIYFIDGNHDDHTARLDLMENHGYSAPIPMNLCQPEFHERLIYLPRGCTFQLAGYTCLAAGGSISVDKDSRKPYVSYWPEEVMNHGEINRCLVGEPVDIVFAHDSPDNKVLSLIHPMIAGWKDELPTRKNREALLAIAQARTPKAWFHGHYHVKYQHLLDYTYPRLLVQGVANTDGNIADSWVIVEHATEIPDTG